MWLKRIFGALGVIALTAAGWAIGAQRSAAHQHNIYAYSVDGATAVSSGATYSVVAAAAPLCTTGGGPTFTADVCPAGNPAGSSIELPATQASAVQIVRLSADQSPAAAARVGLASTGLPTRDILLLGGLFALGVAAVCIASFDRRWFRRNRR